MSSTPPARQPLPIDSVLPDLIASLRRCRCAVVHAPTGAGKTTRVAPSILDAGLAGDKRVVILEPRRLAARAAARRIAFERGGRVGEEVGYHVRFDRKWSKHTRVLFVTPGILLRMLQDDACLESVGFVVFDEFHERGLESDLALGMVRLAQQSVRDDLGIVVMSATLSTTNVAAYLDNCPVIASEGRLHPVEIVHEQRPDERVLITTTVNAIRRVLDRSDGDVLVFLPGMREIRQTERELEPLARARNLKVLPLHGDLSADQQDEALLPAKRRKVVLATNVAETSVTVEGVTAVVDTGLARMLLFDPFTGLDRLRVRPISRASADQRSGRAGRTSPGVCIRLWSAEEHRQRPPQTEPEIRRVDVTSAVLQLLCWGEKDLRDFPWLEPPREASVEQALTLLRRLGALDPTGACPERSRGVTARGHAMAKLPMHPRLARLMLEGARLGQPKRAALAAALLSERNPFAREVNTGATAASSTASDLLMRIEALESFEQPRALDSARGTSEVGSVGLDRNAARFILQARDQFYQLLDEENESPAKSRCSRGRTTDADEAVLRALLPAYFDRLARRRRVGSDRAVMVGGRGVRLGPASGVHEGELFLCLEVDDAQPEAIVRAASLVEREWLPAEQIVTSVDATFDESDEQVVALRTVRFEDLVLEEGPAPLPSDAETVSVLAAAAAERFSRALPPDDSAAAQYLTRLHCLREWMPELELPACNEDDLRELLPLVCRGARSLAEVRKGKWVAALQGRLTPFQRQAVEREAPERCMVPSGSRVAIQYGVGRPPVLAVRLQELFGLRDTPRIAGGRVRVLLHLLAPNFRPQQVTDDLASFWTNAYPQVRSELRRRYPKHAWPEDPMTASPVRGPRRKG